MSTIERIKRKRGGVAFRVSFYRGRRVKVTLPQCFTLSDARALANCIDEILAAQKRGGVARVETYLESAPPLVLEKLARAGLVDLQPLKTLGELLDDYEKDVARRLAPSTVASLVAIFRRLRPALDLSKSPVDITPEAARSIIEQSTTGASPAYARQIAQAAAAFFHYAAPDLSNPFNGLKLAPARKLDGRDFDVPAAWSLPILNACPSKEWRVAFALWRFGGLRFREAYALQWADVNFDRRRLVVHSSKTSRYGKPSRLVPLFPEIAQELDDLFLDTDRAAILSPISETTARKTFAAIITRAGYSPWARLFQNMRATRENELIAAGYPQHVVADWLGHTSGVQSRYYLRTLDKYFDLATAPKRGGENRGENGGENGGRRLQISGVW
ncbi:tyrosine-type recombinase/integrase [Candidatus Saccharibacteria bacterium]|nr:tyrosine-type recombinase/integrase [Candidatus Saccharibacteria bacterium]